MGGFVTIKRPNAEKLSYFRLLMMLDCRLITYRQRFARAAPAPRAKRFDALIQRIVDSKNRGRASPVKMLEGPHCKNFL